MRPPEGRSFRRGKRRLPEKNAGVCCAADSGPNQYCLNKSDKMEAGNPRKHGLAHRRVSEAACRTSGQEGWQENWQENWREKKTKAPETGRTLLSKKLPHPRCIRSTAHHLVSTETSVRQRLRSGLCRVHPPAVGGRVAYACECCERRRVFLGGRAAP
jgi:hypothetical protein